MTSQARPRRPVIKNFFKPSRVEQNHRDEVNINSIMDRFKVTGQLPVSNRPALYGDFSTVDSFQTCQEALTKAEQDFMALPAKIRKRFDNDPAQLIDFVKDEANTEEAIELGIIPRPEPESSVTPEPDPSDPEPAPAPDPPE